MIKSTAVLEKTAGISRSKQNIISDENDVGIKLLEEYSVAVKKFEERTQNFHKQFGEISSNIRNYCILLLLLNLAHPPLVEGQVLKVDIALQVD